MSCPPDRLHSVAGHLVVPNILIRSAAFRAQVPGKRRMTATPKAPIEIASLKGITLFQTAGEVLDQNDLDIVLTIVNAIADCRADASEESDASATLIGARDLLLSTGRQDGGENRKVLDQGVHRLATARFTTEHLDGKSDDSEVQDWAPLVLAEAPARHYAVTLTAEFEKLFSSGWTAINADQRRQLGALGRWLHAFYSSHDRKPFPITTGELRRLCGQDNVSKGGFEQTLTRELAVLAKVTGWKCGIELGKVHITRAGKSLGWSPKRFQPTASAASAPLPASQPVLPIQLTPSPVHCSAPPPDPVGDLKRMIADIEDAAAVQARSLDIEGKCAVRAIAAWEFLVQHPDAANSLPPEYLEWRRSRATDAEMYFQLLHLAEDLANAGSDELQRKRIEYECRRDLPEVWRSWIDRMDDDEI